MVHTQRPLQEKMALFWHNHFAIGYTQDRRRRRGDRGTQMMATKPSEDPAAAGPDTSCCARWRSAISATCCIAVAGTRDARLLDGRTNVEANPQENFAREVMELFTWGVGNYAEDDV